MNAMLKKAHLITLTACLATPWHSGASAQEPTVQERPAAATVGSQVAPPRVGHHAVREVLLVKPGGGRLDAARQEDWIAFDMADASGRRDIYLMRLESGVEKCLTCENPAFRKQNALNPAFHPSGNYLVIQAQSSPQRRDRGTAALASPWRAFGSEIWVITRDGRDAWQITGGGGATGAVDGPHFSHEGDLLAWSERLSGRAEPWGEWGVEVAELPLRRGVPRLGKIRTYRAGSAGLVLASGFTPDDRGLLVSAAIVRGLPQRDLVRIDLETRAEQRLTTSPDEDDDLASSVPASDALVWVSDRNLAGRGASGRLERRGEVWLRSASGALQERLTYFNDPRSEHYLGDAAIDDLAWTADGESLLLHVVSARDAASPVVEGIYRLRLGKEFQR